MELEQLDLSKIFDVIIVGAGPAGCVLASRLSEVSDKEILLIEAGPDAVVPGSEHSDLLDPFCLVASDSPQFRWPNLSAEVGESAGARASRPYIQGCGVGGASNINGMGVDRGQPGDYDDWKELGAEGWGWDDVLPYFIKLENDLDFSGPMHGAGGPMPVRRLPQAQWAPFAGEVGRALLRRGFPLIDDYMTEFGDGLSSVPTNCMHHRVSAAMAYLTAEVRRRRALHILSDTTVDRISIEGSRASGVFVRVQDRTLLLRSRETILSCGALYTPALLMRSGIGPRKHLAGHGIDCVRDLSGVGSNLQNHPHVTIATYLPRQSAQPPQNVWFLQNWLRFSSQHPGCPRADMHLMTFNKCAWHALGERVGAIVVTVLKSYAKGQVELTNADPAISPSVRFNVRPDSRDDERLIAGVRLVLELLQDKEVAKFHRDLFTPNNRLVESLSRRTHWNGLKAAVIARVLDVQSLRRRLLSNATIDPVTLLRNNRALEQYVLANAAVQYHVCGTCRMGRADDAGSVVDHAGRVHGVPALRVVDASIFPTIPRGYTHFIVLMAAEKIADAIKVAWSVTGGLTNERPAQDPADALSISTRRFEPWAKEAD